MDDAWGNVWDIGYTEIDHKKGVCPRCGNKVIKPNVVFFDEQAPNYAKMYETVAMLDSSDVIVVMGTSGQVVPIDYILMNKPGHKILNNLEQRDIMGMKVAMNGFNCWDYEIYKSSTEGVDDIQEIIEKYL